MQTGDALVLGGPLDEEGWQFGSAAPGPPAQRAPEGRVLWRALYRDLGRRGTLMEQPDGESFLARAAFSGAVAHAPQRLLAALPGGDVTAHECALAIGWEGGAWLYVDIVHESEGPAALKAKAYDALHLRHRTGCHPVLVWVRGEDRIERDTVEALAYPYAFLFGMPEEDTRDAQGYAALRSHVTGWLADARPRG